METNYLRTFMVVLESGSMSEAARRLDLTPAAVAQQMRVLERDFGVPLLRRSGRTVSQTEGGHRLAERARVLLAELTTMRTVVGDGEGALELTVGATNTMLNGPLPIGARSAGAGASAARIVVRSGLTSELYDEVLRGRLDVAMCLHPAFVLRRRCTGCSCARSRSWCWRRRPGRTATRTNCCVTRR
jgi:DNA-binding transcriptional LysR family regulator